MRNGDHPLCPFECDTCIFRKLKKASPNLTSSRDKLLLAMIRRMNLDAFWARARSTVYQNSRRINQTLSFSESLGLCGPFEHDGPYPFNDHCGYEIAASILMHSRRPGRHDKSYTQYETIRKLRSAYSSHVKSTPNSNVNALSMVDHKGKYTHLTRDKCGSLWFIRFMMGLKYRMGNVWKPNKGLSHCLLLLVIHDVEEKIKEADQAEEEHAWIVFASYLVLTYVVALRGSEGLMLELQGLRNQLRVKRPNHCVIVLFGKLKGEEDYREHQIPCINITKSGINVKYTIERLVQVKEDLGIISGPAISDPKGFLLTSRDLDARFHEVLVEIFERDKSLFPPTITAYEDVVESYRVNRSLRRTANTRALEEKVTGTDIDLVSKWEQKGSSQRLINSQPMKHHYAQFDLILKPFLRYTYQM